MSQRLEIEQKVKRVGRVVAAMALAAGTLAGSYEVENPCGPCEKMGNGYVKFCRPRDEEIAGSYRQVSCDKADYVGTSGE